MSRHPFEQANDQVHRLRVTDSLLVNNESGQAVDFLPTLAVGEVNEVETELDRPGTIDRQKLGDEYNDVMVLLLAILQNRFPEMQPSEQLDGVNGYGRHSAALENLKPVVAESGSDPKALIESLRRLWSIAIHLPVPFVGLNTFSNTIDKVLGNRPPTFYNGTDPLTGKILLGDEASAAFTHFEKVGRKLRTHVGRTLRPEDWQPYFGEFAGWQNSSSNLAVLEHRLNQSQPDRDIVVSKPSGLIFEQTVI
ncbi:MAG: hypothetical protein COY81_04300 [Candidatus Pacebacteria bacterium CG_4_10_14_0_8_um_filter_43_12]|nr:MAG: hypothetical protein COY81_04300 [Candidatus Pacebacteria bacterium CG_4_10_14_0_8_um_filter_43_12]